MTNEQIENIKFSLECCIDENGACDKCPYSRKNASDGISHCYHSKVDTLQLLAEYESHIQELEKFYITVKSYYKDLDSLAKRLQDDYAGDKPFEQMEEDRLGLCSILEQIDKEKEIKFAKENKALDMPSFAKMVTKAREEALARQIAANTIVIDKYLRYIKPFDFAEDQRVSLFPPMIMGMELKFAELPNNADFLLFKADKTETEYQVNEIKKQAVTEFVEQLKTKATWEDVETCDDNYYNLCVMVSDIDETLKEFLNNDSQRI